MLPKPWDERPVEVGNKSKEWWLSSSGRWRRVALIRTDVSEDRIASIFRVTRWAGTERNSKLLYRMATREKSSETSVLIRATRRHLPEDDNHHSHRRGNLKSYKSKELWDHTSSSVACCEIAYEKGRMKSTNRCSWTFTNNISPERENKCNFRLFRKAIHISWPVWQTPWRQSWGCAHVCRWDPTQKSKTLWHKFAYSLKWRKACGLDGIQTNALGIFQEDHWYM
jgi:hypothetical protein